MVNEGHTRLSYSQVLECHFIGRKDTSMLDAFSDLADQWLEAKCYQSPSAMHGWLAGHIACGARINTPQQVAIAIDYLELLDPPSEAMLASVKSLYESTLSNMNQEDMTFSLLLPSDEDADVDEQVDCLAQWSKGFLDGFGAAGTVRGQLAADIVEILGDFDAFSQASVDDPTDPTNAALYMELTEHARLAAMTVFYALNQTLPQGESATKHQLH